LGDPHLHTEKSKPKQVKRGNTTATKDYVKQTPTYNTHLHLLPHFFRIFFFVFFGFCYKYEIMRINFILGLKNEMSQNRNNKKKVVAVVVVAAVNAALFIMT